MNRLEGVAACFIDQVNAQDPASGPGVRVRNAATLVIVRGVADTAQVLMGRRHEAHKFMPNMVVFPGGRVDVCDARLAGWAGDLPGDTAKRLSGRGNSSAQALALAAVRETFEETGLIVGTPGTLRSRAPAWSAFSKTGHVPTLAPLHFFARATTPPGRPRRFDTRFFMMDADHLAPTRVAPTTDELSGVEWLTFDEAAKADIPIITRVMLKEAQNRLADLRQGRMHNPVPYYRMAGGKFDVEWFA